MLINKTRKGVFFRMLFVVLCLGGLYDATAQRRPERYYDGYYEVYTLKQDGLKFKIFDFNNSRLNLKVAYFGQGAGQKYESWKRGNDHQVLCYFAVGFAQEYESEGLPLGLSVESGSIINRSLDPEMDGILEVSRYGVLSALDIEKEAARRRYHLRNLSHRGAYLSAVSRDGSSVCQSQLLYSHVHGSRMGPAKYGNRASRRFLALATDQNGEQHYLVVDLVESAHLNEAGQKALEALQLEGYSVQYLFNHDTGSRNIMNAFDDEQNRLYAAPVESSEATQLLVFYRN